MQEGDTELGGLQIPHGNNVNPPTPTPGPQPAASAVPQNPQPVPQSSPQPTPQLSTPQSINQLVSQPADQLFSQTFTPNDTTDGGAQPDSPTPQPAPIPQQVSLPQSFQQFSTQLSSSILDDGDITTGGVPQKSKKLLVVAAAIVLIIIMAGALTCLVFQQKNNSSTEPIATLATNYREAFNEYVNYIFYGEDSINNITESINSTTYYAIWSAADNKDINFFNKAKNLLEIFENWQGRPRDELLDLLIDKYSDTFDFYYLYSIEPTVPSNFIEKLYINDGKNTAAEYIEERYKAFKESSKLAQDYASNQKEVDLLILEKIDIAHTNGCLEDNSLNQECLNALNIDFPEQRKIATENAQNIVYSASHDIVFDCFTLASEIYNLKEEQNGTE